MRRSESVRISRGKQFFITFSAFFVLGASFKVMVLVEGLTEVRPENAIPPVAGLICGPVGALACGLGNLAADLFGSFALDSILGVIANFMAAFLPYRLWHLFSDEPPNLHRKKNILLFIAISTVNAFTTAWILSFGLCTFFGTWIEEIYTYVFFNNLGFSIGLGMPLLIVLTSDSVLMECDKPLPNLILGKIRAKTPVCTAYFLIMLTIFVCVFFLRLNPQEAGWLNILSALSLAGLVFQIV
jgi:energy-coupling factor transport system substrate-specific component